MDVRRARSYYEDRTVLITGHSGFKGSWLTLLLHRWGARVVGLSKDSQDDLNAWAGTEHLLQEWVGDVRDRDLLQKVLQEHSPDVIFHMAAWSQTLGSYEDPMECMTTNVNGSINLLDAIRQRAQKVRAVVVTSDKVYRNREDGRAFHEEDELGGSDVYSASKAMSELAVRSFAHSFFPESGDQRICTCRAGNVIGGGDENILRLVPSCIQAWTEGRPVDLRMPDAVRPWTFVLDVLMGYLLAGAALDRSDVHSTSFNFGPPRSEELSVKELVHGLHEELKSSYAVGEVLKGPTGNDPVREHTVLRLDSERARRVLGWAPRLDMHDALRWTADWYGKRGQHPSICRSEALRQIDRYLE